MLSGVLILQLSQAQLPRLEDVEAKVSALPGVELFAEIVSPSVIPIHFKLSPKGLLWTKYPTTESFIEGKKNTTWMPDRREYAESNSNEDNPLPVGYHSLWAGSKPYRQIGDSSNESFNGVDCVKIPCRGSGEYTIDLFVEKASLLPRGSRVTLNGQVHEIFYKRVEVREMKTEWLRFRKPLDARPAGKFDPIKSLIKPGTKLTGFRAKDFLGNDHTLTSLFKGSSGLVMNFWFSACTGCIAEMPYLVQLKPILDQAKIRLVGVNSIDQPQFAQRTSKLNSLSFPTLVGEGSANLTKQVGVGAYPVTLVVDKDMKVVDAIMGFDKVRLTNALKALGVNTPSMK